MRGCFIYQVDSFVWHVAVIDVALGQGNGIIQDFVAQGHAVEVFVVLA